MIYRVYDIWLHAYTLLDIYRNFNLNCRMRKAQKGQLAAINLTALLLILIYVFVSVEKSQLGWWY